MGFKLIARRFSFFLILFLTLSLNIMAESKEKIITCEVMGGLGNQLFQIATTLSASWDLGYESVFPALISSPSYLQDRPVYWSTIFKNIKISDELVLENYKDYHEIVERAYAPILLEESYVRLTGYWQSHKYFSSYRNRLLSLFELPDPQKLYVEKKFSRLTEESSGPVISVHLRLGDYLTIDGFMCLWKDEFKQYYAQAIAQFSPDSLFMVFSDDILYAKEFFSVNFPLLNAVFPKEEDYIELYLMAKCDHNIIANSTFSWWGAYLNQNPQKIVVSPKEWTVAEGKGIYFQDYLLDDWVKISVLD